MDTVDRNGRLPDRARGARIGVLAGLLLSALVTPLHADERTLADKLAIATTPTYLALAAIDGWDTVACVRAGRCHEANPILKPVVERHGIGPTMTGKVVLQAGFATGVFWAMHRWPAQKKYIVASYITMTVLQGVVVVANRRTLERASR